MALATEETSIPVPAKLGHDPASLGVFAIPSTTSPVGEVEVEVEVAAEVAAAVAPAVDMAAPAAAQTCQCPLAGC